MKLKRRDFIRDYGMIMGGLIVTAPFAAFAQVNAPSQPMGQPSGIPGPSGPPAGHLPQNNNQQANQPMVAPNYGNAFYQGTYFQGTYAANGMFQQGYFQPGYYR